MLIWAFTTTFPKQSRNQSGFGNFQLELKIYREIKQNYIN